MEYLETENNYQFPPRGKLLWSDEFNMDGMPNNDEWYFEIGMSKAPRDLQYYTDTNAYVQDDCLVIETRKEEFENEQNPQLRYSSSRLVSKRQFKYGIFEAKIKVTRCRCVWPEFWLRSFDECNINYYDTSFQTNRNSNYLRASIYCSILNKNEKDFVHKPNETENLMIYEKCKCKFCVNQSFHIYTIDWSKDRIKFYVDQSEYFSYVKQETNIYGDSSWPFDTDMNIVFNTFVRGKWPLNKVFDERPFPTYAFIDYIRYYESL